MTREPKFYVFQRGKNIWTDVLPGDVVVAHGCQFYKIEDFFERTHNTNVVITKRNPMIVLSRIDGSIDDVTMQDGYSTFVLFSISKGILATILKTKM